MSEGETDPATSRTGDPLNTRIVFDGEFRGVAFKGDVFTGPELTFRDTGRWFGARGNAEVAGARLDIDGRAADLFLHRTIDADATLGGSSLSALKPFAGAHEVSSAGRAFRATGHVRIDSRGVMLRVSGLIGDKIFEQ